jgi:hypothetical protein
MYASPKRLQQKRYTQKIIFDAYKDHLLNGAGNLK